MENKINVAKLLRDCPSGMELDCTMYENLYFDGIDETQMNWYPIKCYTITPGLRTSLTFSQFGEPNKITTAKCVIFPKGKTTWEGFVPPIKYNIGDVVISTSNNIHLISCRDKNNGWESCCGIIYDKFDSTKTVHVIPTRLATEEEKQELFQAIKENGYRWDIETKTLEKLIEPYFKVGDKIKHKCDKNNTVITITGSIHDYYYIQYYNNMKNEYQNEAISFTDQDKYELINDKFDINTLVPFESKVLVRDTDHYEWEGAVFGRYDGNTFFTIGGIDWRYCIPYEGNEHLFGTTNDCDDFYKTWEK